MASRDWLSLVFLIVLLGIFFHPVLFGSRVLLPADILLSHPPWSRQELYEPHNALLSDQIEEFYPDRLLAREAFRSGSLPLWSPFSAGGRPLLGNGQSAVFFPINMLSYFLPLATSFAWIALTKLLIAGFSTYLFLRRLGRSHSSACLAGCSFMFSGFLTVWLNHPHTNVAIWLPLLFLLADRLASPDGRRAVAMLSVVVGIQFLGGHPETSLHVLTATAAYVAFLGFTRSREEKSWAVLGRLAGAFAGAVLLGSLLAAVQLLPLLEYLRESAVLSDRTSRTLSPLSLSPPRFLEMPLLFFPYLYGTPVRPRTDFASAVGIRNFNEVSGGYVGVVAVVLALAAVIWLWRENPRVRFFALLGGISWAIAYDVPVISNVANSVPPFAMSLNQRSLLLVAFSLSCLAAFGLDWISSGKAVRKALDHLSAALALAVILTSTAVIVGSQLIQANRDWILEQGRSRLLQLYWAFPTPDRLLSLDQWLEKLPKIFSNILSAAQSPLISAAFTLGLLIIIQLRARGLLRSGVLAGGLIVLTFGDLWLFGRGYNPMVEPHSIFPSAPAIEFLKRDPGLYRVLGVDKVLLENTSTVYKISDIRGEDGINIARYKELLDWTSTRRMHNVVDPSTYPNYDSKIADLLNVKYVLSARAIQSEKLRPVYAGEIQIYENLKALPRAYAVFHVISSKNRIDTKRILEGEEFDPSKSAILEGASPLSPTPGSQPTAFVRVVRYEPRQVIVRATMSHPGLLVLGETFYPGWRATVNGVPTTIYRTNHALRSVRLDAGVHQIDFHYDPLSVKLGIGLSLAATLALLFLACRSGAPRPRE